MIKLDFPHRQAGHCESGVTRNLLNYHGLAISEPVAFGIGAGLFFSYLPFLKMQHAPTTSFRVWPGQVFDRATRELGVKTAIHTFRDPRESMAKLNEVLKRNLPVGLQVLGPFMREDVILRVGHAYELARGAFEVPPQEESG